MIRIEKLADRHIEAIKSIQLAPEQVKFAGTAKEFLAEASDTTHLHVIRLDNDIVGFFKIDTDYASNYDFCPNTAIGLRTFVIDQSQQGKGIGTRAVRALVLY
ncbi:GNAT family N-acetyltransferase, partial [Vibrio cyclitrophicus]|uniref:GNAT family N-acetyltransferase n=2 Tax=Vibrionaceae TaxID=641 RepID=UPI000379EB5A